MLLYLEADTMNIKWIIISYFKEATEIAPNISNQLLDYLFATIRLKENKLNRNDSDRFNSEKSEFDVLREKSIKE